MFDFVKIAFRMGQDSWHTCVHVCVLIGMCMFEYVYVCVFEYMHMCVSAGY